jgi:YHS domain-containing protein
MVLDPHCKSYVPKKDAYAQKGNYFCSKECALAYLGTE